MLTKTFTQASNSKIEFEGCEVTIEFITPQKAEEWLSINYANRKPSPTRIKTYGADMEKDRFVFNGDAIRIGYRAGRPVLIDGQNRLHACVKSRHGFYSLVVRGLDYQKVMGTVDKNRIRTLSDNLVLNGVENAATVAAISTLVWKYDQGVVMSQGQRPSYDQAMEWYEQNQSVKEAARIATTIARAVSDTAKFAPTAIGAGLVLGWRGAVEETNHFFEQFKTGEGLYAGDPALALRKWAAGESNGRGTIEMYIKLAVTIKALSAYNIGKPITQLRWTPIEAYPKMQYPFGIDNDE